MSVDSGHDAAVPTIDARARLEALGDEFRDSMPSPKLFGKSEQEIAIRKIERYMGARDSDSRFRVMMALVHVGILNGTGPNTDWKNVKLVPGGGMEPKYMLGVLDSAALRGKFRKFMNAYGYLVDDYLNANPAVDSMLAERAVRNGIPITNARSAVDFILLDSDNPSDAGYRHMAKQMAVMRANRNSDNSLYTASKNAVADANAVKNGVAKSSASQSDDRYGPV